MDPDRLLDGLNEAQRQAVTSSSAPLCVLAGAGSGKTRVLTRRLGHRVAVGDADPRHVLALTFTRRAAGELTHRLGLLGLRDRPAAGTFHAVALAQLRTHWSDGGRRPPNLLDRKSRLLGRMVPRRGRQLTVPELATEIEWAKARMIAPDAYVPAAERWDRRPPGGLDAVAVLYARYEQDKSRAGLIDFDDLLGECAHAIETDPRFAAAQRWRFRHLFVDEYQDVNPLQQRLLEAWRGPSTDLCVVGDPHQAIYAWNGADASFLGRFAERFPAAEIVALTDNYRSSPQILAAANAVLDGGTERARRLHANLPPGPPPTVTAFEDDRAEARGVARAVRERHRPGRSWSAQAVLVRTNAQTALLEEALRHAGIPCRVRGGGTFLEHPAVRVELVQLRASRHTFAVVLADLTESVAELEAPPPPAGDADDASAPEPVSERAAALATLVRLAHEYAAADADPTPGGFLAWLRATVRTEGSTAGDAVELVTFHAAKGLEWSVVHLAGLEQGFAPMAHARTTEAVAEERRLFYVALTRAGQELHLTWARRRTFGARTAERRPSPYLDDVARAASLQTIDEGDAAEAAGAAIDTGRERLAVAALVTPLR
ncbi:ATP-dependent DNA helicase UvrD2 [soil metagenome]